VKPANTLVCPSDSEYPLKAAHFILAGDILTFVFIYLLFYVHTYILVLYPLGLGILSCQAIEVGPQQTVACCSLLWSGRGVKTERGVTFPTA
jgi:hypothetical protein